MLLVCTPTVKTRGSLQETFTLKIVLKGSSEERVSAQAKALGALLETASLPVSIEGGALEIAGVESAQVGSLLLALLPDEPAAEIFSAWLMNTRSHGMGEYTNYPFNSVFRVGTEYFALSENGIEVLSGGDDLGAEIEASVVTGLSNLGADVRKVLTDAYMEIRSEGSMKVDTLLDEAQEINYEPDLQTERPGIYFKHMKLARGVDTTHTQIRIRNVDGAGFDLRSFRLITQLKTRR